jgi:hypothetical protein
MQFGGSLFGSYGGFQSRVGPDLSKVIGIEITRMGYGGSNFNDILQATSNYYQNTNRVFIYTRDNDDRLEYKPVSEFITNYPEFSIVNPIYITNSNTGGLVDTQSLNIPPYYAVSGIFSAEAANQYDSNMTQFVQMQYSVSDGVNLTVTWQFWLATFDDATDTITLKDKIFEEVTILPASLFANNSNYQARYDARINFTVGAVKASPGNFATTWAVAKFKSSYNQSTGVQTFTDFLAKMTTDSGATFTDITSILPASGLPVWNDNENKWMMYDGSIRKFYYADDINGPWTTVDSPTGL